jgi:pimeloyl-ACP methyl ester carboxylesterase
MNVIVDTLLINYRRQGKGPQILMLHGWGDTLGTFDAVADILENDFEIIRLDLPGFGNSQPPHGSWGLDDYGRFVSNFISKINVTPTVMIGHSNGGAILINALANDIIMTDKLVLLSSAGIRNARSLRNIAWRATAKVGKVATAVLPESSKRSLRARLYSSAGSDMMVAPHLEASFKRIVSHDVRSAASSLHLPTLIISGSTDTATPPEFARTFHSLIKGSALSIIDGSGHFAHQEQSKIVADTMKAFLA